jgi:UDP-glucose 4-epimerase
MRRAAVTGSSGFVGSHLIAKLAKADIETIEIDLAKGRDITDWKQLEDIEGFDLMIHLAGRSYVPDSYEEPGEFYHTNIVGTLNALELCRKTGARMIFISSYVYGVPEYLPIDEKHPTVAFNPYAQTKLIGEELCQAYNRDFGLSSIVIRPFNIYGKGQGGHFLIPTIISQARSGAISLNDLRPRRDYIHIDDVTDLLIKAMDYDKSGFEIFNAGSGESYSVEEIARMVAGELGGNIPIESKGNERKCEVPDTIADISKAKDLLDWEPRIKFEDGLKRTAAAE